jgi:hypothetical protein
VNDLERWGDPEGSDPDLTPERMDRMRRRLTAAIAEDGRRRERRRTAARVLGGALAAACLVATIGLAAWVGASSGLHVVLVDRLLPEAARAIPDALVGVESAPTPEPIRSVAPPSPRRPPGAPHR